MTAALLVGALAVLSGCVKEQPDREQSSELIEPVVVSVDTKSLEQAILGEIYRQTLLEQGRSALLQTETAFDPDNRIDRLYSGEADLVVGCTGSFLSDLDPSGAAELSESLAALDEGPNSAVGMDQTHAEFIGSLPGFMTTTNPSSAQGCADEGDSDLPQNIVPVFSRQIFERDELEALESVTRALTSLDLEELKAAAEEKSSVSAAVEEWLQV
ncbi:hypothetical protein [Corynebacterium alimapuense]|uniref:hypothetical protein n=1 Tax=Corynebacterium alimapuense TaxID=1576874 RepID=UPI000F7FF0F5|nr:hypothetical protein [Corynebacterium alimapuense]